MILQVALALRNSVIICNIIVTLFSHILREM